MEIFRTIAKISLFYCWGILIWATLYNAQNPLHTFPRNFSVDGEAANLLQRHYIG